MADRGVHFEYEKDIRRNWIYSTLLVIMILLFVGASSVTYTNYENDYSVISLLDFYGSSFFPSTIATAPLVFYLILLCNLHKRFVALNSLLRLGYLQI